MLSHSGTDLAQSDACVTAFVTYEQNILSKPEDKLNMVLGFQGVLGVSRFLRDVDGVSGCRSFLIFFTFPFVSSRCFCALVNRCSRICGFACWRCFLVFRESSSLFVPTVWSFGFSPKVFFCTVVWEVGFFSPLVLFCCLLSFCWSLHFHVALLFSPLRFATPPYFSIAFFGVSLLPFSLPVALHQASEKAPRCCVKTETYRERSGRAGHPWVDESSLPAPWKGSLR